MNELTRAELIEMICPTDATYDCNQGNFSSSCDKCDDVINYLLDRYDAKVRADAIAEFIKALERRNTFGDNEFEMGLDFTDVLEVAKQLKEKNKLYKSKAN